MRTIPLEPNVTEPAPEGAYMTGAGTRNTSREKLNPGAELMVDDKCEDWPS